MIIDKLAYSSAIRNKSPFLKAGFAIACLLICVGSGTFLVSGSILSLMMVLTVTLSKTDIKYYKKLMLAPFTFLLLGTVVIAVDIAKEPMGLFSMPLGKIYLVVFAERLIYVARLILVSMSAVSCLYFMILTTPMTDIFIVMKKVKIPILIIELMMMTYRYIFVLFEMAIAISTAQNCRLANVNAKSAIQAFGGMLSTVLFRSLQKANFLFDAMESRCYDGNLRVLEEYGKASGFEKAVTLFIVLALTVLAVANKYFEIWI